MVGILHKNAKTLKSNVTFFHTKVNSFLVRKEIFTVYRIVSKKIGIKNKMFPLFYHQFIKFTILQFSYWRILIILCDCVLFLLTAFWATPIIKKWATCPFDTGKSGMPWHGASRGMRLLESRDTKVFRIGNEPIIPLTPNQGVLKLEIEWLTISWSRWLYLKEQIHQSFKERLT